MHTSVKICLGLVLIGLCAAAGVWGTRWVVVEAEVPSAPDAGPQATLVSVAAPRTRMVEIGFTTVGTVRPARSIELRPLSAGRVDGASVRSGTDVAAGDVLLRLDARAEQAAVAEAEATAAEARQEYQRYRSLQDENVTAEARVEEARAALARAEAGLSAARAALDDRSLTAPFAGTVGLIDADPGEYVDTATAIGHLDDLARVHVDFSLPERYFARVAPGQSVRVTTAVHPDRVFDAEVTVRAPRIDDSSRNFTVRATLDNPDRLLAGGMFVEAKIVFDSYEALTLPDDAMISEGSGTFVFAVENGTARRQEITLGADLGGRIEVADGIASGTQVVVAGWDNLSDGASVTVAGDAQREALE